MTDLTPQDPVGIGGYRLLRRLGAGGMGRVYLGRSSGGRTVAVKLVKEELAADPSFRTRFRMEVEAARRVGERWTAPVLDADTEADTPWVATGYVAGPSLEQVISAGRAGSGAPSARQGHGPLPPGSVRVLAYGLASALLDIHGAGLVHRDLKPSNVLLTIDGPRVIDFGIARALDEVPASTLTSTGMVVGSPGYMSPEQITGGRLSPASDVFSLGAVLGYAATGQPPFGLTGGGGGVHALMYKIASEEPDLGALGADPADEEAVRLRELIGDCLAKDPAARPAPEEVVARVQPVSVGASAPPWLPAGLLAELGREAVRLLDTDTPPRGSGKPEGSGPGEDPTAVRASVSGSGSTSGLGHGPGSGSAFGAGSESGSGGGPEAPTSALPASGGGQHAPRRRVRRSRRALLAAAAAVVLVGVGVAAAGTGIGPLGGNGGGGGGKDGDKASSDVPAPYLGTWVGAVERDGRPTGQYRRFDVTKGKEGEIVATSISLGTDYECKSDGKLASAPGAGGDGEGMRLDTKVVKSTPAGRCAAIGVHTLTAKPGDVLEWRAAGRTATLRKVADPRRMPDGLVGEWRRPLSGGGHQTLTVRGDGSADQGLTMVSDGAEHCEARVDVFSPGTGTEPARLAPPDVDRSASRGTCAAGDTSTLRVDGDGVLLREFPDGRVLRYQAAD
ncbi:serine/threonine protein kinase [Streptomyces oryzae]|uniref:Serine/threonine protein kinase n=1 Tax=Streptomyces oryzae TaxID=1434886 RepID=A0ABS3X5C6_9ACTN|nr:serine/threonine-protein kinase [Streptomyces oryzae]MBO8190572.1 serine/threonine protein kinase [Streptomyces oryzae]